MILWCCPQCRGPLRQTVRDLVCARCGPYPRLGGVPILVKDPHGWCARYAVDARRTLRAAGLGGQAQLARFARHKPDITPESFTDDWTDEEVRGLPPVPFAAGAAQPLLRRLNDCPSPRTWLGQRLLKAARVVEVGSGAGGLTRQLHADGHAVVSIDISLRAVLLATHAGAQGVVGEATALPVVEADVVVAENVVDLLDRPAAFLRSAAKVAPRLLVTSPAPETFEHLVSDCWRVAARVDGLVWLRRNSARFTEVYSCVGFDLRRRG
jgi:hypothetical protein